MNKQSCLFLIFCIICSISFGQKDSIRNNKITSTLPDSVNKKHLSIKRLIFINAGVGYSTILDRVYYVWDPSEDAPYGTSQSLAYNVAIDYGIKNNMTIGFAAAYETVTGVPIGTITGNIPLNIENLTRLNLSIRALWYIISTPTIQLYWGGRIGASFWTDYITSKTGYGPVAPTLGSNHPIFPSFQVPLGIKIFPWHTNIGMHFEIAIGTPYFAEGGLTFKL